MNSNNPSVFPETSQEDDEISILDLLQVIVDNLRILILGPLCVGVIALAVSFFIKPTFTASTQFMPPQMQQSAAASMLQSLGALGGLAGAATGLKNPADQYVAFIKSRVVADALIERFDLMERYESDFLQDARKSLQAKSSIASGKDGLIKVEVTDNDPQFAADLTNAYVQELGKLLDRLSVTEAQQRRVFFEKQLTQTKERLIAAEQALAASGVSTSVLNVNPELALEGPARLRAQVTAQEVKMASMRTYLAEGAPQFRQALNELSALRAQLAKAEKVQNNPVSQGGDYINKYREFKYQETLFELFAKQFEIAKVDESREGAVLQVVDAAVPPERKSGPKKALIAIAATLGSGFVLLFWVFVRHALRASSKNPESAAKLGQLKQSWRRALGRA